MNNSLERLIAGIIATLRADVIPNVTDAYARGQAIGGCLGTGAVPECAACSAESGISSGRLQPS